MIQQNEKKIKYKRKFLIQRSMLIIQTSSQVLWEAFNNIVIICKNSHIYISPLSIAKYSFIQCSELGQRRVNEPAHHRIQNGLSSLY